MVRCPSTGSSRAAPGDGTAYPPTYPHRVSDASRPSVRSSPVRVRVEHLSDPLVQRIAALPTLVPAVAVLALLVVGAIFRHVVGAICFGVCGLLVAWLLYLAWPRLTSLERMMRGAVLLLLAAITVVCATS